MYRLVHMSGKWIAKKIGEDSTDAEDDLVIDAYSFLEEGSPVMYVENLGTLKEAGIEYEITE